MAKEATTVSDLDVEAVSQLAIEPQPAKPKAKKPKVRMITIQVPIAEDEGEGLPKMRLDWTLEASERRIMHRLTQALRSKGAKLASGRPVDQRPSVAKWLFQQIAEQLEKAER